MVLPEREKYKKIFRNLEMTEPDQDILLFLLNAWKQFEFQNERSALLQILHKSNEMKQSLSIESESDRTIHAKWTIVQNLKNDNYTLKEFILYVFSGNPIFENFVGNNPSIRLIHFQETFDHIDHILSDLARVYSERWNEMRGPNRNNERDRNRLERERIEINWRDYMNRAHVHSVSPIRNSPDLIHPEDMPIPPSSNPVLSRRIAPPTLRRVPGTARNPLPDEDLNIPPRPPMQRMRGTGRKYRTRKRRKYRM